ncbi:class I adenylate cyclase [Simiduia aestuariiviva]|uniref:Adenylate cyclase class 1 n=1 Tax=Simiduia aestuariiviva TaxID=1510459 RepID=A0A839UW44_9GAMM|nr:class I adenylate cyclase [Simiduia aestuariiviva]MBB3169688.1 adenylate cyclase class 1 [Simiduia aestuariiviva]
MRAEKLTSQSLPLQLDRDSVAQMKSRFLALNAHRLTLAKQPLSERQQMALEALPLLLHFNHPRLPGYLSKISPAGFSGFTPTTEHQQLLKQLARGFRSQANPNRKMPLLALFVMGSVGTVAQSAKSDMDFWLCYSEELSDDALSLLHRKCEAISQWAKTLGLEWHFFLMQADAFRKGEHSRLSSESSGSVQHFLLLDEFYRSAILLAGRMPLWWFIGDTRRADYDKTKAEITHKTFLRPTEWIDFGPVGDVPAAEYVSAAVWQLYKSIQSPYKSLLKLLILEVYISRYPNVLTLSDKMKLLVYTGVTNAAALDPYLLLLEELTAYFVERKEFERLELMRQCFYFKVGCSFSALTNTYSKLEEESHPLLAALQTWQWSTYDFDHLDRSENWNAQQVLAERKRLVNELTASYRQLLALARSTHQPISLNNQEISILGRKLHAAFERSAGKIEFINPGISKNIRARYLFFEYQSTHWSLYLTNGNWEKSRAPLASGTSVSDLICWCLFNDIAYTNTRIKIAGHPHYNEADCRRWLAVLQRLDYQPHLVTQHANFTRPAEPRLLCILFNDPAHKTDTDSADHYSLLTINSWGEVRLQRFGSDLQALLTTFCKPLPADCTLRLDCLNGQTPRTQIQQLQGLINKLQTALPGEPPKRLLLGLDSQWVLTERRADWQVQVLERNAALWRQLAQPLPTRHQLHCQLFGEPLPHSDELRAIAEHSDQHAIHIFYRIREGMAVLYLCDERASIVRFQQRFFSEDTLLRPLHHFIRACLQRNPLDCGQSLFGIFPVNFFEMRSRGGELSVERRLATSDLARMQLINLQFAVHRIDLDEPPHHWQLDAWLDGEPVLGRQGQTLLSAVAHALLVQRRSGHRYPCYITDLDLSACAAQLQPHGQLQTSHYFQVKIRLEQALYSALLAL